MLGRVGGRVPRLILQIDEVDDPQCRAIEREVVVEHAGPGSLDEDRAVRPVPRRQRYGAAPAGLHGPVAAHRCLHARLRPLRLVGLAVRIGQDALGGLVFVRAGRDERRAQQVQEEKRIVTGFAQIYGRLLNQVYSGRTNDFMSQRSLEAAAALGA